MGHASVRRPRGRRQLDDPVKLRVKIIESHFKIGKALRQRRHLLAGWE
jgi:hypothetical protein